MIDVEVNGLGNVLDKFEIDADFKLFGVDGIPGAGVGDEFERNERRKLREDVGRRRNALIHDRVKDGHQSIDRKRLGTQQLSGRSTRTFLFQSGDGNNVPIG